MSIVQVLLDAVRSERWDHVEHYARKLVAFDVETWLITPGISAPPLVCGSLAYYADGQIEAKLVDKVGAREAFREILRDPECVLVAANAPFDVLVMAVDAHKNGEDLMPEIFALYEQGRVYDVQVAQQLHAIAEGTLNKDPITMRGLRGRYSLATCVEHVLGRVDAKKNDAWRLRYAELDGIPVEDWPTEAREYPLDDARNTLECALAQLGCAPRVMRHIPGPTGVCPACNQASYVGTCFRAEPQKNLHSIHDQVLTHWCMYVGAAWGFKVDQNQVRRVVDKAADDRDAMAPRMVEAGLVRPDGTADTAAIARRVSEAYDAVGVCPVCDGTTKAPSEKTGKPINCKACSATGFDFSRSVDVPRTPTDRVSRSRDVLDESGDETLMEYAQRGRLAKTVETYGPYLAKAGDKPLVLRPNVLLETDRTSYSDVIQQFPRAGGLRSCIVARPGYTLASVDYNMGEIITHAQSCVWLVGFSDIADVLLSGQELHKKLGAAMLGVDYAEFDRRFRDKKDPGHKQAKDARQAAKPGNFGFPGGMGAPKMALTQRMQGPDTPCAAGPVILDEEKNVRGYRGLRFCVLMDGAERCGIAPDGSNSKLSEYKGRPCPPTCAGCVECAARLRDVYMSSFREMGPYLNQHVKHVLNSGEIDGLDPGTMIQHVSRIVRAGCNYSAIANGYFQSLLGRAAKLWLRRAQRECCDRTARVPDDACPGGVVSAYAGRESPLLGSRVIAFYHDELFGEVWNPHRHDAATRLSEIGVRALQETCPDLAPAVRAPPAMMPAWFKEAEPVYHRGILVPWTPDHDAEKCSECAA